MAVIWFSDEDRRRMREEQAAAAACGFLDDLELDNAPGYRPDPATREKERRLERASQVQLRPWEDRPNDQT
jgi:hypothetical protein